MTYRTRHLRGGIREEASGWRHLGGGIWERLRGSIWEETSGRRHLEEASGMMEGGIWEQASGKRHMGKGLWKKGIWKEANLDKKNARMQPGSNSNRETGKPG